MYISLYTSPMIKRVATVVRKNSLKEQKDNTLKETIVNSELILIWATPDLCFMLSKFRSQFYQKLEPNN